MAGLRAGIRNRALPTVKQGGARRKKSHVHILCTVIRKFHVNVTTAEGWSGICPVQVRSSCKEYSLTSERLNHVRPQGLICDVRCHPRWPRCTSQHTHTHTNSDAQVENRCLSSSGIMEYISPILKSIQTKSYR